MALHGPRSVGKSTLLRGFAESAGVEVLDLDDPVVCDAVRASPLLAVSGGAPVCVDEYQKAPELLDALKSRLNREGSLAGTAVLTGSTRHDAVPRTAQALTGRLHVLTILPLSQGEIAGVREDLLERLLIAPEEAVAALPTSSTTRAEYVQRLCVGGFPMAVRRTEAARNRWFDDYARLSVERDALELARVRQRQVLRAMLDRLAGQTGQVLNVTAAATGLDVERKTVDQYVRLLEDLFLVQRLPAWGKTLRARATRSPKLHVVDSGLAARLLRISPAKMASLDPTTLTEFGNLLETFVVGELRKQVSWLDASVTVGHWRTADGDEVDLVVERDDGAVVAFEVKAGERVPGDDLKALRKLRDALGDRFLAGVALSTGPRSYTYEDRIHVLPIDRIWRPTRG
ncbi:MAG TPA: ATP-binding protein [Candidatus Limnocylindrales bacterium]|nr:ATP-binding protein [Candidatus Limnocylindrales bacterium]